MADGELAAAIQELTNRKLAKAIEELREKYDRIDAEKEAAAARGEGVRVGEEKAEEEEGRQKRREEGEGEEEEDDSDDEFLNDPELEALRAARLAQMKRTVAKRQEQRQLGHGEYREIVQDEFLPEVTGSSRVVCVFFHRDFERCRVLDKHMERIAPRLPSTKFVKIDAEKAPFFVNKLKVKVIPTTVFFEDGVATDRLFGFSGLIEEEGAEDFPTRNLVHLLKEARVADAEEADQLLDILEDDAGVAGGGGAGGREGDEL